MSPPRLGAAIPSLNLMALNSRTTAGNQDTNRVQKSDSSDDFENDFIINDDKSNDSQEILSDDGFFVQEDDFNAKNIKTDNIQIDLNPKSSKSSKSKLYSDSPNKNQSFEAQNDPVSARKKLSFVNIDLDDVKEQEAVKEEVSKKKKPKASQIPSCYNRPPSSRRHIEDLANKHESKQITSSKPNSQLKEKTSNTKAKNTNDILRDKIHDAIHAQKTTTPKEKTSDVTPKPSSRRNTLTNDTHKEITPRVNRPSAFATKEINPFKEITFDEVKEMRKQKDAQIKPKTAKENHVSSPKAAKPLQDLQLNNIKKQNDTETTPTTARINKTPSKDIKMKELPISKLKISDIHNEPEIAPTTARTKNIHTARDQKPVKDTKLKTDKNNQKIGKSEVPATSRVPAKTTAKASKPETRPQTARTEKPKPIKPSSNLSVLEESILLRKQCAKDFCDEIGEADVEIEESGKTGIDWLDYMAENEAKLMLNFDAQKVQEDSMLNLYESGAASVASQAKPGEDPFDTIMRMMNAGFEAIHQQSMREKEILDERIMLINKLQEQLRAEPPILDPTE